MEVLAAIGVDFSVTPVSHLKDLEWLSLLIGSRYIMIFPDVLFVDQCHRFLFLDPRNDSQQCLSMSAVLPQQLSVKLMLLSL